MRLPSASAFLSVLLPVFAGAAPVTPGWENANPARQEFPPEKIVWTAPAEGWTVQREDGALGAVTVADGVVRIAKTNDVGRIVVTAPSLRAAPGKSLRFFADVEALTGKPLEAGGYLCAWTTNRVITSRDPWACGGFDFGGHHQRQLINSAPATPYRKYRHLVPETDRATVAIVVEGPASESTWRGLRAEDGAAAERAWKAFFEKTHARDRSRDRQDLAAFEKSLAADVEHSACVKRVKVKGEGEQEMFVSQLFVDGKVHAPVLYKECEWGVDGRIVYAGKPLQDAGVTIGVINLRLGDLGFANYHGPWSEKGFDVRAAVETVRDAMRCGEKSLFVLALGVSAYPAFTEKEHPDQVWIREDGRTVIGNSGSACPEHGSDGGMVDPGDRRWPWVSLASSVWRAEVKRITGELFAELRRTGLMKRIVGVHFNGYHDGQLAMPFLDCSPCAKAAYADYLKARHLSPDEPAGSFAFFSKQLGFLALEDFSREAKRLAGKPIVSCKWEMGPLDGGYDIGSFLKSDAVDILVPQADYIRRQAGIPQGLNVPFSSLHCHGKLLLMEFDLRTWAATDRWAQSLEIAKGLNTAEDAVQWRTIFRKHAGLLTAARMGWWMYDMGGGWYSPPEIVRDMTDVVDLRRAIAEAKPSAWRPDVAFVLDELAFANYNTPQGPKVRAPGMMSLIQWLRNAESGVPCDCYLASDFEEDPALVTRYRAVLLSGFVQPDARQKALLERFRRAGIRMFVIPPEGAVPAEVNRFARAAGAFVAAQPGVLQVDLNGDFLSVHCLVPGTHEVRLPFTARAVNVKDGSSVVADRLALTLTAGETCWFRLARVL